MGNVRPLNHSKYGVSKNRFKELYYWCLQYQEWKCELNTQSDTLRSVPFTCAPVGRGHGTSDPTQRLAVKRTQLEENCELIEQTAMDTDPEIYPYLLKAVTNEDITYQYLKMVMEIPCGKDMYYDRRRKFYWLLSQRKKF